MGAEIEVLQPGIFSAIQDLGRFGYQKFGVPQSGVMDRYAMRICNLILGNAEDSAVLEITLQGPHLKFQAPTAICISGADLSPQLNGHAKALNMVIEIKAGDILKFGKRISGFRSYIGILGGFRTETLMNSQSWYEGLTSEFRLKKGMKLYYDSQSRKASETYSTVKQETTYLADTNIEVYPGPEFDQLTLKQKEQLLEQQWTTDESSNRMAIQLKEDLKNEQKPIITAPVMPGTVQLTPSGKIIILMRDCQTTGGYPRILQLSEKGIQVLSQKIPGSRISFKKKDYPDF